MAFPASFPLSSIPRNPDSRLPDQNERKRSKEKQWLNAITQGEDPMASSRHPPPKQAKEPACTRGKGRHTYAGIDRPKSRTKHHASRRVNSDPFSQGRDRDHDRSDTNSGRTTGDGKRHSTGESRRSTPTSRKDTTFMSGGSGPPYSQHGPLSFPKDHLQAPNSPSMLSVAATTLTTKSNGSDDSTSTVKQESHDKKAAAVESFPEIHSLNTVNVNEEQNRYQTAGPILDDFRAPEQISGMSEDFSDTTSSVVDGSSDISSTGTPDTPSSRSSVPSSAIWPMPEHPTKWTKHANVDGQSLTGHNGGPDTQHTPQVGPQGEQSREADVDERQSDDDCGPDCQECHPRHQEVQHDRFLRSQHNSHMYPPGYVGRAPEDVSYHQAGPYRSLPAPPQGRPVPPAAPPPPPFYSRSSWSSMPAAPEPPDLSKPVNTGYELLALKLSDPSSTIKPAYRKFEAMHHRILLHIQDELCELEERVRRLDLLVAQLLPQEDGRPFPASRRAEVHSNNELLVARKHLLGMVFVKLEQYNRAMTAYSGMTEGFTRPSKDELNRYREWMTANRPVHKAETGFLDHNEDLVVVSSRMNGKRSANAQPSVVVLVFIPLIPLVLFSAVPTYSGRIFVTMAIVAGGWVSISGGDTRNILADRDWAIVMSVYLGVMALVACVV